MRSTWVIQYPGDWPATTSNTKKLWDYMRENHFFHKVITVENNKLVEHCPTYKYLLGIATQAKKAGKLAIICFGKDSDPDQDVTAYQTITDQ